MHSGTDLIGIEHFRKRIFWAIILFAATKSCLFWMNPRTDDYPGFIHHLCVLCVVSRISALQVTQKHFIRNLFDLSFSDHFQVDTSILHSNRAASKILCNSLAHFDSYKRLRSYCEFRHCNVTLVSISILFLLSHRNHFLTDVVIITLNCLIITRWITAN